LAIDLGIAVDERQILSLFGRELHIIFSNKTVKLRPAVYPQKHPFGSEFTSVRRSLRFVDDENGL
jgi:hypothetical protein